MFVDQLIQELQPMRGAKMLDLGCGAGRHSRCFASKGFRVTGIDLAPTSIRKAGRWKHKNLHFYRHDMRMAFGQNCYDYIFSFFTSFGYFQNPDDDRKVIQNISNALKPGGVLVLDYMNSKMAEKSLVRSETKNIDGVIYKINRWSDETHIFKKIQLDHLQNRSFEVVEQVAKLSVNDFEVMFSEQHLQLLQQFGDYNLESFQEEKSPRLIMIVRKI
jgi:2-polyprenyl-3-methyl-5-hydroxy-6-metoxy-1,4-benzoquinol methylase